ncbi:MAG: FAD-dependent oxidoreductase [bacterium]|nr:FAD-dependent oxidoreductase [bacterium]
MKDYAKMLADCTHGQPPACSAHCPFNLDIKTLIARFKRGKIDSAYRLLRDAVIFPKIICNICDAPCERVCERNSTDAPLNLRGIERAIIDSAKRTDPIKLNVPAKEHRIAIIGAGLSGLACAIRLAERKYNVTLYEARDEVGGSLAQLLDKEIYLSEIEHQFKHRSYELRLSTPITTLEELREIDAQTIYVATGAGGEDFGLLERAIRRSPLMVNGNVFFGGSLIGSTPAEAVRHGNEAANMMEMYINTGSTLDLTFPPREKSNKPDPALLVETPRIEPAGDAYTMEEALAEAQRCLLCDCDICMKQCPLIPEFSKYPDRMAETVRSTVAPASNTRLATRMVASCDFCGICKDICPYGVDVRAVFEDARAQMFEEGTMPVAYSEFWLRDMAEATSQAAQLIDSPGSEPGEFAFFPGCQLGASDPRYVTKTYELLRKALPGTSLMLTCCGAPEYWAGNVAGRAAHQRRLREEWESLDRPKLICACTSCIFQLAEAIPEAQVVSLYELPEFAEAIEAGLGKTVASSEEVSLFHPCSTRLDSASREGARRLVEKAGLRVACENDALGEAACCGWGGQYRLANDKMANSVAKRAVERMGEGRTIVTYCTNCRNTLHASCGDCAHILDIALGLNPSTAASPLLTQRRENRFATKRELEANVWGREASEPKPQTGDLELIIGDELAQTISDRWIYISDIAQTLAHCEAHNQKLYYPEEDCFIGHLQIGFMTYWVKYRPQGSAWEILDAYCHRMHIKEGKQWVSQSLSES